MRIDEYVRFTKYYEQPHVHIYVTQDELNKLSKKVYTNLNACYDDFKNTQIWNKLIYFFKHGIHYAIVKNEKVIDECKKI